MLKPVIVVVIGYLTANLSQIEFLTELLGDEFSSTKNAVALAGLGYLLYRAAMMIKTTQKEKDQAYEEKKIDIQTKAWSLAHDKKKANEEGLIEVIVDSEQTVKELKQTVVSLEDTVKNLEHTIKNFKK